MDEATSLSDASGQGCSLGLTRGKRATRVRDMADGRKGGRDHDAIGESWIRDTTHTSSQAPLDDP